MKDEFSMFQTAGIPILKVDSNITDSDFHERKLKFSCPFTLRFQNSIKNA